MVRALGSIDAQKTRENNTTNSYFWMLNKYGNRVPIAVELELNCLKRGFVHTDRKVYSDNREDQVQAPIKLSPLEAVAAMAEKMQESAEINSQILEEVSGVKRKKPGRAAKKEEDVVEEASK